MKLTKTMAVLAICIGAGLFALAGCKNNAGDGDTEKAGNVAEKWALKMTVDATGDNIKVGDKAIIDSNAGGESSDNTGTIVADTEAGKSTATGHELERQHCGKRFYQEITAGLNNTEGFRTNIVINVKDGTWRNADTNRTAGAGMLFDFYEYKNSEGTKTYDFFFLSFKPEFSSNAVTSVTAYFERYSGVAKKLKKGIYSRHDAATALGSNYIQESVGTWDARLYTPSEGKTFKKTLTKGNGYTVDADGNIIIGVDVKQFTKGVYTVRIGTISYTVNGEAQTLSPTAFKQSWKTSFAKKLDMGECGETSAKTGATGYIKNYEHWTHVKNGDKDSNLKGGVMVYGFAPYGTKPVASYFTCNTKLKSGEVETADSNTDYVGDWNRVNELDGAQHTVIYEDGVKYESVYY